MGLVDVPLTNATSLDGPLLVDGVSFFVEPEGFFVEVWRCLRCEGSLLFFNEELLEDRVYTSGSIGDVGGRPSWGYSHEVAVTDAIFFNISRQFLPSFRVVTTTGEVFSAFPFRPLKGRVGAFFLGQFHGGLDSGVGDVFKELIRYL